MHTFIKPVVSIAAVVLLALSSWATSEAAISAFARPQTATITEVAGSASSQTKLTGTMSISVNTHGVFTASGGGRTIANLSANLAPVQSPNTQTYQSPADALDQVGALLRFALPRFAGRVSTLMRSGQILGRARQVIFTYTAFVKIVGGGSPMSGVVNETCFIAPSSKYSCLGATYNSKMAKIIYAVYQQGAVAQGMASSWALPHPGILQWAVLKVQSSGAGATQSFVPEGGKIWHSINFLKVGGALGRYGLYDAYQVGKIGTQQVLFNCASVVGGTCTQYKAGKHVPDPRAAKGTGLVAYHQSDPVGLLGTQQMAPLIQRYGASGGILLYGTTVAPVYLPGPNGTSVAKMAVAVQQRTILRGGRLFFISGGAGSSYKESGVYGFLLNQQIEQYSISAAGAATYTKRFSRHVVSPTTAFNKSVTLHSGNLPASPDIINPFPAGDQIYSYLNDKINDLPPGAYVQVAPIVYQ